MIVISFSRVVVSLLIALVALSVGSVVVHADDGANSELVTLILQLLGDEDSDVRALAFEQIRTEAAGEAATLEFASQLSKLPAVAKVGLLRALAARGDGAARSAILDQYSTADDSKIKAAAMDAIGAIGRGEDVPLLVEQIAADEKLLADAARASLVRLQAENVHEAIVVQMETVAAATEAQLITILAQRRAVDTLAVLLDAATDREAVVRQAAMNALGELAEPTHIASMLQGVLAASNGREREAAEKNVMFVCNRIERESKRAKPVLNALPSFSASDQVELLSTVGRIGGESARKLVESAVKSSDQKQHEMGIKALCNWPDASVAEQLITQIRGDSHASHKLSALRALIRVAALADGRTDQQKLVLLRRALGLCQRDTERLYALSRASAIRIPETLRFLLPYTEQPPYAEAACLAIVELAHHRTLREPNKTEFDTALDKVIARSKDPTVIDRANRYKKGETWVRPKK